VLEQHRKLVGALRELEQVVESQPATEQTAHDLRAIRRRLEEAKAHLSAELGKSARRLRQPR
jgi:hypothetical protein